MEQLKEITFNKIDLTDLAVVISLSVALFAGIYYHLNELAMSIASGLIGYLGGSSRHTGGNKNAEVNPK